MEKGPQDPTAANATISYYCDKKFILSQGSSGEKGRGHQGSVQEQSPALQLLPARTSTPGLCLPSVITRILIPKPWLHGHWLGLLITASR